MYRIFSPLSDIITEALWPSQFFSADHLPGFLSSVYLVEQEILTSRELFLLRFRLAFEGKLELRMPGLEGISLAFVGSKRSVDNVPAAMLGPDIKLGDGELDDDPDLDYVYDTNLGEDWIELDLSLTLQGGHWKLAFHDATLELRFPPDLLRPRDTSSFAHVSVRGTLVLDENFDVDVQGFDSFDLSPCEIGSSGIGLSAEGIKLDLSRTNTLPEVLAAGFDESFLGVFISEAKIEFPDGFPALAPEDLIFTNCAIGSGGFTGKLTANYYDEANHKFLRPDSELFGIPFRLKHVILELRQNAFVQSEILGQVLLPFFENWVEVEIGLDLGGGFHVRLADADGEGLKKVDTTVFGMELDSIAFEVKDGLFSAKVAGKLTPTFGGLDWPTFDVKELSIDSKGHVHLDGGWLNVPELKTLDFYGFPIEISQIGFGKTDDGGKWIGFSGGLHLVDGLQAGASVEGLRITWYPDRDPKITLNGAGVELSIPDVLYLKGSVSYRELTDTAGNSIHRFDGDIRLMLATPELNIDGTLVIGSVKGPQGRYNFFAIYVDVEVPGGITLASTGLAIYGFAGLFALQMEPNKKPDEMWFSIDHSKSFYHRDKPGITDITKKWEPRKGSFAVGAGITLATFADNGYSFNGKFLIAIVIPGPIVLIQGAASLLKKREDKESEGQFRALAVLDGRAGNLLIGLDAEYKTGKGGEVIQIEGGVEAFYSFHDPTAWHLWLGQNEPRSLRIRALFAKLVEANAYFMLDAHKLALGAWYGFNRGWIFGPLSIRLEAWVDGNALVSFKPSHFHGDLWLHGLVDLKAFGFGFGIVLDAKIAADLFRPYHLKAELSVGIKLPWPFKKKKLGARIVLEWGPRKLAPPLPLPVVTIGIEHLKSSVKWPLPRGTFLLPSYDDGEGFLTAHGAAGEPAESAVPRVPVDARIALTFGRSVHDGAMVGSNLQGIDPPYEAIGDPVRGSVLKVRYVLDAVTLERKVDGAWDPVAASPKSLGSNLPTLWGQWAVVPQLPDAGAKPPKTGQTKLLLGARTPFEFNRHTGSSWEEWVSDALPGSPCVPVQQGKETCFGFGGLQPQSTVTSPWTFPGPPAVTLSWDFGPATVGTRIATRRETIHQIPLLCFPEAAVKHGIHVQPQTPGSRFRVILARTESQPGPIVDPQPIEPGPIEPGPNPGIRGPGTESVPREALPTCINLRGRGAGTLTNPWKAEEGARFGVRGADGALLPVARIERWGEGELGLNAGFELEIDLPCPALWVTLLVTHRPPFHVVAYNAAGVAVATHAPNGTGGTSTETVRLDGPAITRVVIHASGNEKLIHQVCFLCPRISGPRATGYGVGGTAFGPFGQFEGVIPVFGPEIHEVVITGDGPLCLEQICVTPDPEAGQVVRQDERIQHQLDELAHWQAKGEVLAPDSFYKLTVKTHLDLDNLDLDGLPGDRSPVEHAYFRTGGPPALTALSQPEGVTTSPFETGLEDLTRYVRETTPPTVPPPGEKPILFKPFYRAYDVGVEFNEDYVEQMYRMDQRDLGLYLFDASNQPARDGLGRLLVLSGQWGEAETLSLSERETRWITMIAAADCLPRKLDPKTFPRDSALTSSDPGRVLAPDTLHEARLVPLLLHEAFPGNVLGDVPGGWYVEDTGPGPSSLWQVGEAGEPPSRFVEQLSTIGGAGPERPGTLLLLAESSAWTDYRVSVYVRAAVGGAVGVVVRRQGPGTGYRFSLDGRVRRLAKGDATLLGEDHFAYRRNRDYLVTFEALGSSLKVYLDGEPVFEVTDEDFKTGRIGLYACQSPGARFSDVRVDDFRAEAPVAYRFQLTTSLFANFFHHLHSFQDETWRAELTDDPGDLLKEAVELSFSPPDEKEARAYEALAKSALKSAALQNPRQVEVTRLEWADQVVAFLLRSPEPLAWDRVTMALFIGPVRELPAETPGAVKMVDASFGWSLPGDESVTLLLREAVDLSRWRVELRLPPSLLAEPEGDPVMLLERFQDDPKAVLARFTVADLGKEGGPSDWRIEGGALIQILEIRGGAEPELPGTVAVTGDPDWTDYRLIVDLRSDSGGGLGVAFRWVDGDNHYRLSLDAGLKYRRLIKREKGVVSILWEEEKGYAAGEPLRLTVEAVGSRLTGFLGSDRLFEVTDSAHAAGQVGLYASNNPDARFETIEVRRPSLDVYALIRDRFAAGDLTGWQRLDEAGATQPSTMEIVGGALAVHSFVQQEDGGAFPGTYAFIGPPFTDAVCSARLLCHFGGAIGMVVRGQDLGNYYRFSMDAQRGYRRLVKKVQGQTTVLWEDGVAYTPGQVYELTVAAVGNSLRGYLDGAPLFSVEDGDVPAGVIALYAWSNPEALFSQVRVFPPDRAVGPAPEPRWTTWYAFGGEERLPAGTRLRIFAGPEAGAPPAEPGTVHRFAPLLGETGRARFPAAGAELRVVGPEGPGHTRILLPYSDYVILPPPRVVRRADGTGLVVVPSDGSHLGEAGYQLSFTYDRKRGEEVHPFSQAGDQSPERVAIDIPWKAR